ILFIYFLLSMAGMDALIRQADIVRDGYKVNDPLSNVKPNLNFQVSGFICHAQISNVLMCSRQSLPARDDS
ncbi:MAG TPA: hypothetical protein VN843_25690, partial [Anaerolineales bacterium]|nr:hypothetical protein [Anaerolineales bacterium]